MTKIKICGITNINDALMVTEFEPDAMGFVFAPSKRKISPETAREIIKRLPLFITTVGVFMDTDIAEVNNIAEYTRIDVVQLHGSETQGYCERIKRRVIKRISICDEDKTETLIMKLGKYHVDAYLLDPGSGSGKIFNWQIAAGIDLPLIIAGGLTPENIKDVIKLIKPYGVDVSSGVEQTMGLKDKEKVKKFIEAVRSCYQ